jgi:hypothetical protein
LKYSAAVKPVHEPCFIHSRWIATWLSMREPTMLMAAFDAGLTAQDSGLVPAFARGSKAVTTGLPEGQATISA